MPMEKDLKEEALRFHREGRPGKITITPSKPLTTQRELSLAYSPGVAQPVLAIAESPDTAFDYTVRGNLVAVISNGTAILGLGNLGALASKPVMEGKAVLFKRFADVDSIDIELDTEDVDQFVNAVAPLWPSFGGINLEDIKAPECFMIEQRLRDAMPIPVFHDDQHGTAIIAVAGLINALNLTDRKVEDITVVVNGAGSAGIACAELIKSLGVPHDNVLLCDTRGVIYKGREAGMNQWKSAHAIDTDKRTLAEAVAGSDVFLGLSVKGALTPEMVRSMASKPIIFAMANPDPEITPEEVADVRGDAIMATGRSDYPNQVNNVLGFPYIFRGALDVRATQINDEMKLAAAQAIADLAREDVPDEVAAAYGKDRLKYGPDYILPVPFDPRLIEQIPAAVAQAAIESGVATQPIEDFADYRHELRKRLDPTADILQLIFNDVASNPKRVVFAEGEEERVIRAALQYKAQGYGHPILIGREEQIRETLDTMGMSHLADEVEIHNARKSDARDRYLDLLYERQKRRGWLRRDCARLVNQDRNVFGACMVAAGDADALITGITRRFAVAMANVMRVIDPKEDRCAFGVHIVVTPSRTLFIADTSVRPQPDAEHLADVARQTARLARRLGQEPRVAFLSYSSFGNPMSDDTEAVREAVCLLDAEEQDFEYEGEMQVDVALDPDLIETYPFSRLSGPANVLVMPDLHAANISAKLLREVGGSVAIGPLLVGMNRPVQIVPMRATVSEIVAMAALAGHEAFA